MLFTIKKQEGFKMKNLLKMLIAVSLVVGFGVVSAGAEEDTRPPRKIVIFQEEIVNIHAQAGLLKGVGATIIKPLPLVNGMSVYLPPQAKKALEGRPEIQRIDDDIIIEAIGKPAPAPQPSQVTPWGIARVGAPSAWSITTGSDVKVAVVDTGIDLDHRDLTGNIKGQVNTINPLKTGNDDNGHGTHVAGTIAAINNSIGVIGVGPNIFLYAVKVLGKNGSGWLSDVIEGLGWCVDNGMQVVNMSLGSSSDSQSLHDAVNAVNAAGIIQAAAAGNDGGAVIYPAAYPVVIAVSAIDNTDTAASWSSRGPEVDLAAPGAGILSTYNNGYYKTLSGTSMATPHVSGAAALALTTGVGVYDLDGDGIWDPDEVQNKLEATADDLGAVGKDDFYGAGVVRADLAAQ